MVLVSLVGLYWHGWIAVAGCFCFTLLQTFGGLLDCCLVVVGLWVLRFAILVCCLL